ncbi:MAG: PIG-L family deacetylase [Dehalococcoidia bacterium]
MAEGESILVAIAHPDDESLGMGGTMAAMARLGWHVTVLCATRGEVGEISDPALATPETLGAVREQELRDACAALGVTDVRFLPYRDSGMEGTPENQDRRALVNAPDEAVAAAIAAIARDVRPTVMLTWDPSGGYGHPDHLAVYRAATAAFTTLAAEPNAPRSLYYMALPVQLFAELARELEAQGIEFGNQQMRERAEQLPRLPPTTEIDVKAFTALKLEAAAKHRSQMSPQSPLELASPELRQRFFAIEYFTRIAPPWPDGAPMEHALYTGAA